MLAFIVHPPAEDERLLLLVRVLEQLRLTVSRLDTLDMAARKLPVRGEDRAIVVVPDTHSNSDAAEGVVKFAEANKQHAFVVYVAEAMSGEDYRALVRSGSGEWVRWETLAPELLEIVRRRHSPAAGAPSQAPPARIIAAIPTSGGVGTTTVTLETAVFLASRKRVPNRTCILDLNFQNSSLPGYLEVEARFQISEILSNPQRLDEHLIGVFTSNHSSGIDVFCSPPTAIDYSSLDTRVVFALLDEITRRYDFVLVDLPPTWFPWVDNVVIGSDAALVVGTANIPSVRRVLNRIEWLESLSYPLDRIGVAVNNSRFGFFGGASVRRSDIDKVLTGRKVFYVRRDSTAATEAINTGRSMVQSKRSRGLRKDIARVGEWLAGLKPASAV